MSKSALREFYHRFIALNDAEWEALSESHNLLFYKRGELLNRPGEVSTSVFFILKGGVRFYYVQQNKEYIAGFCFENEYQGDYKLAITGEPSKLFIEALEDCQVYKLDYKDILKLYQEFPVFVKFGRLLAEQLYIFLSIRIESYLYESHEQRYRNLYKQNPDILQRVPQYMIASYIGVTPETLSRIRKKMHLVDLNR